MLNEKITAYVLPGVEKYLESGRKAMLEASLQERGIRTLYQIGCDIIDAQENLDNLNSLKYLRQFFDDIDLVEKDLIGRVFVASNSPIEQSIIIHDTVFLYGYYERYKILRPKGFHVSDIELAAKLYGDKAAAVIKAAIKA